MNAMAVSAPGKAFLWGEYAVTEGAPAVVAAVDRRVTARWDGARGDGRALGPEGSAALELATATFGPGPAALALDRRSLQQNGTKLGLGSSAAGSVAIAGAVASSRGYDPTEPDVRRRIFDAALGGHARIAPNGSGADVAASTYGGFIRFERQSATRIDIEPRTVPSELALSLVWTRRAVRTSELLGRVRLLRGSHPEAYDSRMRHLHEIVAVLDRALERGTVSTVIEGARAYHRAMAALGREADATIVESSLETIARVAEDTGGAAKPCGAGGGDVAVAFFQDRGDADRFEHECADKGFQPIPVRWGADGVRGPGAEDPGL